MAPPGTDLGRSAILQFGKVAIVWWSPLSGKENVGDFLSFYGGSGDDEFAGPERLTMSVSATPETTRCGAGPVPPAGGCDCHDNMRGHLGDDQLDGGRRKRHAQGGHPPDTPLGDLGADWMGGGPD